MLSYMMRQILADSLANGPPYEIRIRPILALRQARLLIELENRGIITSGPFPVLTETGVAEAKWFATPVNH